MVPRETSGAVMARFRRDVHFRHTILLAGILLLGLALRLYRVTAPPIDYLSWRDTQTLMVARNFYRTDMNILTPAVDWRTTYEVHPKGTVGGTEFMVVPFLTALVYHLFGIRFWVGRVVPIAFALLGTAYFHRLVARFYGPRCATISALLLTVSPYFLYCGRCHMPEPFVYAMSFAALYYYDKWFEDGANRTFAAAALFALLMALGKPQVGVMVIPMAFLTFHRFGWRAFAQKRLYLFAMLVGVPFAAYMYWTSHVIIPHTGISFSGTGAFNFKRWLTNPEYYAAIGKSVFLWSVTPLVCLLAAVGLFTCGCDPRRYFVHSWLAGALSLFVLMPGSCAPNGYYQLILEPPFAILAGLALSSRPARRLLSAPAIVLVAAAATCSLYIAARLYVPQYGSDYRCGAWIRENTPQDALVLTSAPSPACLYFADRVGWTCWQEHYGKGAVFDRELIDKVRILGATVLAIPDARFDNAYYRDYDAVRDYLYDTWACHKGNGFTVFFMNQPADLSLPENGRVTFGLPESRKYLRGEWGPDQTGPDGASFTTMGPASQAHIRFTSPVRPQFITLHLDAWVPGLELTTRVNGTWIGTADVPQRQRRAHLTLGEIPEAGEDNSYTLTLEASRRNRDGVSIALYGLDAIRQTASETQERQHNTKDVL